MRYSNLIILALAASTELAAAHPARQMKAEGLMRRANIEPAAVPRFIHSDGSEAHSKTDLILMPNGNVISKRDPAWNDTQHEAAYKMCSVALSAAGLCLKAAGQDTAAYVTAAGAVASSGMAAAVTQKKAMDEAAKKKAEANTHPLDTVVPSTAAVVPPGRNPALYQIPRKPVPHHKREQSFEA